MAGYSPERYPRGALPNSRRHSGTSRSYFNAAVLISDRGLRLPQRMSFDKWLGVGKQLSSICSSSAWCLGDWLVYGELTFNGRYREAIEQTWLDYQTLRNYAWVARRFPLSRRRDKLSFAHHAEVAALPPPEQDFWLRKAEELGWPVKRLRREVRASLQERSASDGASDGASDRASDRARDGDDLEGTAADEEDIGLTPGQDQPDQDQPDQGEPDQGPERHTVLLKVPIPAGHLDACQAAASKAGLNVDAWAVLVLTRAAVHDDTVTPRPTRVDGRLRLMPFVQNLPKQCRGEPTA